MDALSQFPPIPIEDVFLWALGVAPQDRAQFVRAALPGRELEQLEVLRLLRLDRDLADDDGLDTFNEGSEFHFAMTSAASASDGKSISDASPVLLAEDLLSLSMATRFRYRVLGLLGRGGMGVVYHAECLASGREVALKLLLPGAGSRSLEDRFRREASILERLDHPGIARLHESGVFEVRGESQSFIATEFVDGENCRDFSWGSAPIADVLLFFSKVAHAVHFAHSKGVVHRDLKPENVIVDRRGNPQIIDFGIALLRPQNSTIVPGLTAWGGVPGTPNYMSPEQKGLGEGEVNLRSDIYSLGLMMFEAIVGRLPGESRSHESSPAKSRAELDALKKVLANDSRSARRTQVAIAKIIAKCLSDRPEERYRDARRLATDLACVAAGKRAVNLDLPFAREFRRLARPRPALMASILLICAALAFLAWDRAANVPRRIEAQERRQVVLMDIARADELIHLGGRPRTLEGLKEAVETLTHAARIAPTIRPDPYKGRLPIYVYWRLGEANYFLHGITGDIRYLDETVAAWETAKGFHYRMGLLSPEAFRGPVRIGDVRAHHPQSGLGGAQHDLAFYRNPREHLTRSLTHTEDAYREFALESECGPDQFNVPLDKQGRDYACLMNQLGYAFASLGAVDEDISMVRKGIQYLEFVVETKLFGTSDVSATASAFQNLGDALVFGAELEDSPQSLLRARACFDSALAYRSQVTNPHNHCESRRARADADRMLGTSRWDKLIGELETVRIICAERGDSIEVALCDRQTAEFRVWAILAEIPGAPETKGGIGGSRSATKRGSSERELRLAEELLAFTNRVFTKEQAPVQFAWTLLSRAMVERARATFTTGQTRETHAARAISLLALAEGILPAGEDSRFQRFLGRERQALNLVRAPQ